MRKVEQLQRSLDTARQHCPALPEGQVEYRKGHGYYIAAGDRSLFLGKFKHAFDFLVDCIQTGRVNHAQLRSGAVAPARAAAVKEHPMTEIVEGLRAKLRSAMDEYTAAEKRTMASPEKIHVYSDERHYAGRVYAIKESLFFVELKADYPTVTHFDVNAGTMEFITWSEYHRRQTSGFLEWQAKKSQRQMESAS